MSTNTQKQVTGVFETYQKARVAFVQSVADLAQNPKNIDALQKCGIMALLRPLLLDTVPSIQHNAAQALGRLANYNPELATAVVNGDILPQLVYSLAEQNKFYKRSASYVLRSVAKHSPQLAQAVVSTRGAVESLVTCLEEFDPTVKEGAAHALGNIARHTADLAQAVVDSGAVPTLVLCVQEPELSVKRIAASALSDIAKHSPELAQSCVDANVISVMAPLIKSGDAKPESLKLKRQVLSCLSQIAKHSVELAEFVVEGTDISAVLDRLKDTDLFVKKNAATLCRELVKHTPELGRMFVNAGGCTALVAYVNDTQGSNRLPGIMALGYIAARSEVFAKAVIDAKGIAPLVESSKPDYEDHVRYAAAWTLGQIGHHSPEHAKAVAEANGLTVLVEAYSNNQSSDDLKTKAKRALKGIIEKCTTMPALEALIDSPPKVQQYVIHQFAKILPNDVKARRDFVTNGSLQKIQLIQAQPGTKLKDSILTINNVYPEEIVQYYSPGFSKQLLSKIDESQGQSQQ